MVYVIKHKKYKGLVIYGLGKQLKTKKQANKWLKYQNKMYKKHGFKSPEWKIEKRKK